MADDWCVEESDLEDDSSVGGNTNDLPYSIDCMNLLQMLNTLKSDNVLQLCCDDILHQRHHGQDRSRGKLKRKRVKSQGSGEEEMSETTSEIRSTHTASTNECRDTRRPTLNAFDYEHEDFSNFTITKTKKCLAGLKKRVIAIDEIEATLRKEEVENDERVIISQQPDDVVNTVVPDNELVHQYEESDNSSIIDTDVSQDITSKINKIELLLQEDSLT